jgi:hypothetical protein
MNAGPAVSGNPEARSHELVVPSALAPDFATTRRLEVAKRANPQLGATLIELYERMLAGLPSADNAAFRAPVR